MTTLSAGLQDAWTRVIGWITRTGRRVYAFLRTATVRVGDRWTNDTAFRRTLTSAITAITVTAIPSAALAAAVGAFLTERPIRPQPTFGRFDDLDEDDDPYRNPWPPRPGRLWDSLT